jgi:multidrug efflux pump subunit AcrB
MNVTQFAIEKKRIAGVALAIILFAGLGTYRNMSRAEDPGFIIRTAVVITYFPGASPERVEQLVTDKLEKVIQEMPEIDFLASQSRPGVSVVFVNIKESLSEMRPIWDSLRRKVDRAKGELPSDVIGPFVNDEFGDVFGTMIVLTGDGYTYAELKEIADDTRNELLLIPEVGKVEIAGIQEERVFVEFNNARLAELGISPAQLQQILEARNIIFPGGEIFTADEQMVLEPSGNFESIEDLMRTVVSLPGRTELVYLSDIAHIRRGYVDPATTKVRYNGQPALVLAVSMREDGNITTLGSAVEEKLSRFRSVYPIGVEFDIVFFQTEFVNKKVNNFVKSLAQAIGIVVVVMLVFLGFRTGLVIASLVPMAMVMALMVMGFFDIGLDQMSLAALIISLGLLVDNAIVMAESIMVQMREGKPPARAAINSASELRVPLLTSSLTTAAAFLPIFLAESAVGEYTAPIFKVVAITLICSWLLSLTMTPLLAVRFLKVKPGDETSGRYDTPFYRRYRGVLLLGLRHRGLTILATVIVFLGVMQLTRFVPQIFFPANDKPIMYADLFLPVGTPVDKTEDMVKNIEQFIEDNMMAEFDAGGEVVKDGVTAYAFWVGAGPPRFYLSLIQEQESPEYAYLMLHVTDRWKMETGFIPALEGYLTANFPDLTTTVGPLLLGPPVEAPVQVRISGTDTEEIFELVDKARAYLETVDGLKDIRDNWGQRTKKLFVRINQPRAQRAGLTSQDIAVSLQTVISGIEITDYREDDEVIPVVLRSVAADRKDIGKLESHNIYVQATGQAVPLKQVADVEIVFQPSRILRRDRLKTVTLNANLLPGYNAIALSGIIDEWLAGESGDWPIGYKYEMGGEVESSGEANQSIGAKVPVVALIIILLLVAQFDSLRRPVIILLTIPLGLVGVILGLLITQKPLGFVAILGVIALAGIVINNAIVLIDRIRIEIEENGHEPRRAVIEACQRRLRPILLTTATTMGGLIPLWFGGGPLFEAMAVAIIFGLMFATVLTLGFVPVMYSILFRVRFKDFEYK